LAGPGRIFKILHTFSLSFQTFLSIRESHCKKKIRKKVNVLRWSKIVFPSFNILLSLDTFASKTAAIEDETADASVGNVTGSNAVNVFLGIGIAWTMAAIYWEAQGKVFKVPVGSLGFSVTIFCIEALLAIAILMIRRSPAVGGELGGPKIFKTISSAIFVFFWCFYVAISALEAYEVINPGF